MEKGNKGFFYHIKFIYYFLFLIAFISVLAITCIKYYISNINRSIVNQNSNVVINIPKGAGSDLILSLLKNANLWNNKIIYEIEIFLRGIKYIPKYGEFNIPSNSSLVDILNIIHEGKTVDYKITFPEGIKTKKLIQTIKNNKLLVGKIPDFLVKEGEFLPETYFFNKDETRENLINRMRQSMEVTLLKIWKIKDKLNPIEKKYDALILASMIEAEAAASPERKLIASVFINRIRINMRLQSDPTVIYGIERNSSIKIKTLKRSDLKKDHDWNTYTRQGLPKTPICNPGKSSIEAAIKPYETDYFYFVSDGMGGHFFAKTLSDHNENILHVKKLHSSNNKLNLSKANSKFILPISKPNLL